MSPMAVAYGAPGMNEAVRSEEIFYVSVLNRAHGIGTGGDSGIEYWRNLPDHACNYVLNLSSGEGTFCITTERKKVFSNADTINRIRAVFKFSISDLAYSFQVSRQAIYKWLSGESASLTPEHQNKLDDLNKAAELFAAREILGSTMLLKRRGKSGRTLVEAMRAGESVQEWAQTMIEVLSVEAKQRAMLDERLSARKRPNFEEWGTPMLREINE